MVLLPILASASLLSFSVNRVQEPSAGRYQVAVNDVSSPEAVIRALYDVISGPAGTRNWERMKSLFDPKALMTAMYKSGNGEIKHLTFTVDDYARMDAPYFAKNGFFEREASHRTERYGQIEVVFSTYESRHNLNDSKPFETGINSIQLYEDGGRWYVLAILWQGDDTGVPLPRKYR